MTDKKPEKIYSWSGCPLSRTSPSDIRDAAIAHGLLDSHGSIDPKDHEMWCEKIESAHTEGSKV